MSASSSTRIRRFFAQGPFWGRLRNRIIGRVADRDARSGRIERTDGSVLIFSSLPLADGGCLYTYLDVTDSTRVERALRERNAALEAADRLKSEFIANVSYELRTPLNAIIGFAEMLDQRYFGELNERQIGIQPQASWRPRNRLLTLINDILDVATIDAGYLQLECGPVDVQELLAGVGMLAARARPLPRHQLLDPGQRRSRHHHRRRAPAEAGALQRHQQRLKFTPPSGSIVLGATRNDGHMEFRVTDTGIGIDPEYHAARVREIRPRQQPGPQLRHGAGPGAGEEADRAPWRPGRAGLEPGQGTTITCFVPVDDRWRSGRRRRGDEGEVGLKRKRKVLRGKYRLL